MFIDAKIDYKASKLLLLDSSGDIVERELIPPYFYVIVEKPRVGLVKALLGSDDIWVEEDSRKPVVMAGDRYVVSDRHVVLRVICSSPNDVPRIADILASNGFRVSASNVRYIVRNVFDRLISFFDAIPLYFGFDIGLSEKITRVKGVVIDVEAEAGKPVMASIYWYRPLQEIVKDDIYTLELPEQQDELEKELRKAPVIYGHNIVGFDIPVLERSGLAIDKHSKLLFDTSIVLSVYGQSLGVGSARSLLDVATILREEVGISKDEIEIKRRVKGSIAKLSRNDLVKYNQNDVVLTTKILNSIAPFIYSISALTSIPPSEVMGLPAGMVAEYALLRYMELLGYIPEYRYSGARLTGERVYVESYGATYRNIVHLDIKAMYPSFVLANTIDPTLHKGGKEFDRRLGPGFIYSFTKRLYNYRLETKKLKKEDPRFDPVDKGLKAILNALAFGVQGKASGLAVMGNPWCPEKIFYGTRSIQFNTIEYLKKHGLKVVYGDTDSFFIVSDTDSPTQIIELVNKYLSQYGLEADLEEVWDSMFIYSKKNYIVRKGDKIIIKGSALHNLDRIYLPEAISLYELIKYNSKEERLKYIKEVIESSPIEDLFFRGHQQVWRIFGKDIQAWKRLRERKERYIVAITPWNELPYIVLKKAHISQFLMPHSAPFISLFMDGSNEVELSDINPFNILEARTIRLDSSFLPLQALYGKYDLLLFHDGFYLIKVDGLYYGLRSGKEIKWFRSNYSLRYRLSGKPLFERVRADISITKAEVREDVIRNTMLRYVRRILTDYGFL